MLRYHLASPCPTGFEMPMKPRTLPDVFTARDIARASGARADVVLDLIASGDIRSIDGEFVPFPDAVDAARRLRAGLPVAALSSAPAVTATTFPRSRSGPGT